MVDKSHPLHDPTLDERTCQRLDTLEAAVNNILAGADVTPISVRPIEEPNIDIGAKLEEIARAGALEIDAIREAARLAIEGLQSFAPEIQQVPAEAIAALTLPPAPATPAAPGWIKEITGRVEESMDDFTPPRTEQPIDEWGRAEIRYQTALKALNGSTAAQKMMMPAAARRGLTVLDLARLIIEEREQMERRVMGEY